MKIIKGSLLSMVISYILSGATIILVSKYPDYQGHPDVPFSGPLDILLLAPFAPLKAIADFNIGKMILFCIAFICF